jgi:hypothetical protein
MSPAARAARLARRQNTAAALARVAAQIDADHQEINDGIARVAMARVGLARLSLTDGFLAALETALARRDLINTPARGNA